MQRKRLFDIRFLFAAALLLLGMRVRSGAQEATSSDAASLRDSIHQMQLQIEQLQTVTREMKEEAVRYRAETLELKRELEITRQKLESVAASGNPGSCSACVPQPAAEPVQQEGQAGGKTLSERVSTLEEDQQLLNGKVDDQYQTKVESAAKRRVKLSGILLMNVFSNKGNVDHMEVPGVALPANAPITGSGNIAGSFGATFRQSELGLEVYGPTIAGAKTRGNFVADFFSEFPESVNGTVSGNFRVRTGTVRMDWTNTSVVAGLDTLFFSPIYPTSFAAVGIPALSYSGNLWGWTPQLRVERRLRSREDSSVTISGGILDPLTGETPPNEFLRIPGAGEVSRQPAYAARLEVRRKLFGQPFMTGVGGYYSRETWGVIRKNIDGWAATHDWIIPFGSHLSLSGEFYAGRAIGGLGAGIGRSIVFNSPPPANPDAPLSDPRAVIQALDSFGGWSQFKIKATPKLEFNFAAGQDSVAAGDVRGFAQTTGYFAANLNQNRSEFANFVYRPRSNLLFSTEFRTLRTSAVDGVNTRANQLNLVMGVLF